jgi:geranylgeranyl diphosphate synthase, type I
LGSPAPPPLGAHEIAEMNRTRATAVLRPLGYRRMSGFDPGIDDLRAQVDEALRRWLADRGAQLAYSSPLIDEMVRLLEAGGKRLRPSFCYWGYRAAGGRHGEAIVRAAASLELLHTFAIVHDDIMDASDERRGEPSVHAHLGLNAALLVGDLALVLADAMFMSSAFDAAVLAGAFDEYSRMRQEVIVGQWLDLQAAADPHTTEERARLVARLKSGRYSIVEPLAIGARLMSAPADLCDGLTSFAEPLGEAFQLRDDLLGLFGERSDVGKPVDSDIREGKRNLLYAKTRAALSGEDEEFFIGRWGADDIDDHEIERLRGLVEATGARAATEALLEDLASEALDALALVPITGEVRRALGELARLATTRRL